MKIPTRQDLQQWRAARKQKREQRSAERLDRFLNGEPPRSLADIGHDQFLKLATNPRARVVTCPQGVVAYTVEPNSAAPFDVLTTLAHNSGFNDKDTKIREIYAANPDVNFKDLESALGIKILSQQNVAKPKPKDSEDWAI